VLTKAQADVVLKLLEESLLEVTAAVTPSYSRPA